MLKGKNYCFKSYFIIVGKKQNILCMYSHTNQSPSIGYLEMLDNINKHIAVNKNVPVEKRKENGV